MPFRSRTWHIAKTGIEVHLMHEFMSLEPFLVFCSKHAHSTNFGLKLMFWMASLHFVAAPDPLWKSVSGALNARVYASKTISCFVATNTPNPLFQSKTHVLGGSMPFRSHTWHVAKTGIEAHLMHEFVPLELFLVFCSKHAQSTTFGLKLMFSMVSYHFVAASDLLRKLASGCI